MFKKSKKELSQKPEDAELDLLSLDDLEDEPVPKKKLPAWVIWPVVGGIVIIVAAASILGGKEKNSGDTMLQVVDVSVGDIQEVYNSSGTIESENTKTYYSPVSAPVSVCNAEVGKTVKNGDLLISFDTSNLERDNQQAQLNLQSAYNTSQASREQNAKAVQAAIKATNDANAELTNAANSLADQVNDLAARVEAAERTYQANQAQHDSAAVTNRIQELQTRIAELESTIQTYQLQIQTDSVIYDSNGAEYQAALQRKNNGTETEADRKLIEAVEAYQNMVQIELPKAQAELTQARAELAGLDTVDDAGYHALYEEYIAAYAQWEAAYQQAQSGSQAPADTGMTGAELANLDISDNLAELAALTPEELLAKGREGIKADMDGVIASVQLEGTNTASQGMALFSIASMDRVRVKIEVSPDDYARMKIGNSVKITVGQHEYKGTLTSVDKIAAKNAKGNPVIGARIHIENPDENICIGATAKISMTVAESKNTLLIPSEAVNASTDGDFVFVIENGIVKKKSVTLGTTSATQVEITSGLEKGDQVVDDLNVDIKEGMKATAISEKAEK